MTVFHSYLTIALALASVPAYSSQTLVPAKSEIVFTARQMGVPLEGRFRLFNAQVDFDPRRPEAAKIELVIDVSSATLGMAETDAELVKPAWFGARLFPQAKFQATAVKPLGGGKFEVSGKLGIKSIVRNVVVPVTLTQSAGSTLATGTFALSRLDYKIGEGEWKDTSLVADSVQVNFRLLLSGTGQQ